MINLTTHWRSIGAHAAIGIVTTSSVALMSRNRNFTRDFDAGFVLLLATLTVVSLRVLWVTMIAAAIVTPPVAALMLISRMLLL